MPIMYDTYMQTAEIWYIWLLRYEYSTACGLVRIIDNRIRRYMIHLIGK